MPMDQLEVDGQPVCAYVANSAGSDAPGVVVFHAWWGLNDDVTAYADRLADAGFAVIAPDLYGGAVTAEVDEAKRLAGTVDEDHGNAIALAALERLGSRPGGPRTVGAVGFSFGALLAMHVAAEVEARGGSVEFVGVVDYRPFAVGDRQAMRECLANYFTAVHNEYGRRSAVLCSLPEHKLAKATAELAAFARDLVPALTSAPIEQTWAGLRPATFDGLPYLGPLPGLFNAFVAAGHFRSGLYLSPATAVVMSQLIRGERPEVDLDVFRVGR